MEYEKLMKVLREHVAIEDMTGRRFLGSVPSKGEDIIGRVDGRLYAWGWSVDDPFEVLTGHGSLGVIIDENAFLFRGELIFLEGYGEWLSEIEEESNEQIK